MTQQTLARNIALKWLYSFLKQHQGEIIYLALISLLTTALVIAQPYLTKLIIDQGLLDKNFHALLIFSFSLLILGIITTALSAYNRIKHTRLSGKILFALREDVFQHLLKLPMSFFQQQRAGDIIARMDRDVSEIQRFALDTLFSTFTAILSLIGTVAMMVYLNWQLSLVLILLVPIEFAYLRLMRPKVEQGNIRVREAGADISAFFAEKIPAIKFIQTSASEARESNSLSRLNQGFLNKLIHLQITEFWTSAIPNTLVSLSRAGIFILGGYWVIQGEMALGSLIAFSTYIAMAFGPVQSLLGLYLSWQRLTVSLDRVSFIRQQPTEQTSQEALCSLTTPLTHCDISLAQLSFSYGKNSIFKNCNLTIAHGSKVGICGASGIGKSTLLDLIQGHLVPSQGQVCINNTNLQTLSLATWRKQIAVVAQDPVIFRLTLADNIRYCAFNSSEQAVANAAIQAGLSSLIEKLPQGIHTVISERGSNLSGGEKQRIAIARAILQQPILLILDEPTSAIDQASEQQIMQTIDDNFSDITRLIVSHRKKPMSHVDIKVTVTKNTLVLSND